MGFLSDLFGIRKRDDIFESLNPLSGMKLLEFVVADKSSDEVRHYFRFRNKASQDEEFIVIYNRVGGDGMRYSRTLWREKGKGDFFGLSDRSPWWPAISRMLDMGQQTRPTQVSSTHFSLRVEPGSSKPTTAPSTAPSQSQQRPAGRTTVDVSEWQVTRGDTSIDGPPPKDSFSRSYSFGGLQPPDTTALIRIECTIESGGLQRMADGNDGLSLSRSVRFYFRPIRLPKEMEFVLNLTSNDGSEGGSFDVIASPVGNDMVVFSKFGGRNDTATLLRTLMSGKELKFELLQDDESLVKLPLPNDESFKQLWDASAQRFVELETMYDLVRSQGKSAPEPKQNDLVSEVRKNPKGYNVWMVEPEPGEYGVLIVKVDRDGKMEDAWRIGETFSDRKSQGAFALDVARNLQIKLMDVVDT